ncbi:MAG: phosphoribosylglycinamide formyltransferase [Wenzhouxiangellaceae bacterium]
MLASGSGTNLQALIDAAAAGLELDIRRVIVNRPQAMALERARRAGIDPVLLDHSNYPDRAAFEAALGDAIDAADPQLIVLAGFMRILGADFVRRYGGRMINLHPSLLPLYRGLNTYQRVLDAGDSEHGASIHFVTAELDGGPVIAQARLAITASDDAQTLARRLAPLEHRLLVAVTALFVHGRIELQPRGVVVDNNLLRQPLVLINDELQVDS